MKLTLLWNWLSFPALACAVDSPRLAILADASTKMWMAGGGVKGGTIHGETDDFSYNVVKDPVHVRDFHATVLRLLGIDHERFSYRAQALDFKLTGVEKTTVVKAVLA